MSCACKGARFCAVCKESERVRNLQFLDNESNLHAGYECYVYKNGCVYHSQSLSFHSSVDDIRDASINFSKLKESGIQLNGVNLIEDFLNESEELEIVKQIDQVDWASSQSGRRKQDYGPRVNFKHQKVKTDRFIGIPEYADLILNRLTEMDEFQFGNYIPFELCNLEYTKERESAIEFHKDDMWIWGERLVSLNLLDGSVMTFEDKEKNALIFVYMPRRSLLFFRGEARYLWRHGILSWHIVNRRIALTMREPGREFKSKTASFVVQQHTVPASGRPVVKQLASQPTPSIGAIRGKTSPYGFFVKMCYEEHRRKFPHEHVLVTEISKKCSEKWKTMNDLEKKRFFELAQRDAERYQAEVAACGGAQQLRKKRRAKKDPNAPKRALSAFFFFSNERRSDIQSKYPTWKVGQIAQELGRAWKALSDEERHIYEKKASDDKERYNEEMRTYKEGGTIRFSQGTAAPVKLESADGTQQQTVQVQYLDQDGNVIQVVTQPAYVTNSGNGSTVYLNPVDNHSFTNA